MSDAHVQVVRGTPDEHELAALVAGLMASSAAGHADDDVATPPAAWSDRRRSVRGSLPWPAGADSWRWSQRS